MYKYYQILVMLLKLDVFFFISFSLQLITLVLDPTDIEFSLTIAAIPFSIIILIVAIYALKHERHELMMAFIIGMTISLAYFSYKLYRFYNPIDMDLIANSRKFLTFFAVICLINNVFTIIMALACYQYFGKGLREKSKLIKNI